MIRSRLKGTAVVLAWPDTYCKHAGAWYDTLMKRLGFNKNGYYKAGHAAVLLIDDSGICHYFDFGRYHSPFQYGRVRSAATDPDLKMRTRAEIINGTITNLSEILSEISKRKACHGSGGLIASVIPIEFEGAFIRACFLQKISPIPYGPFVWRGTNCSRFVRTVVLAGNPGWRERLKLSFPMTFTPSPAGNVRAGGKPRYLPAVYVSSLPPVCHPGNVLPEPERPALLPFNVQWLAGEGAGSWFHRINWVLLFYSLDGRIRQT